MNWKDTFKKNLDEFIINFDPNQPRDELGRWAKVGGSAPKDSSLKPVDTNSKEFKDWFGDSKVIDDDGDPLRVYHGTNKEFQEFSERFIKSEGGFCFTDSPAVAHNYAQSAGKTKIDEKGKMYTEGANVIPVYLSIENPYVVDFGGGWKERSFVREVEFAKREGYDGVVIKNIKDVDYYTEFFPESDIFITFKPTQIKSAISNMGKFSKDDPNITNVNG